MAKWDNKFKVNQTSKKNGGFLKQDKQGTISQYLGTGENAKNSIIYLVLKFSFVSAVIISVIIIINYWFFRDHENKVPDIVGDLKIIWEIVTPIITLALGYAFGKNER